MNPFTIIFLTLQKVVSLHANNNSIIKWWSPSSYFSYKHLKLKLRASLTYYTVTMAICYVMTCSTMTGHLFDTTIVAVTSKEL